jgi:hypothetical protein
VPDSSAPANSEARLARRTYKLQTHFDLGLCGVGMSFVVMVPESLMSAAAELEHIGSALDSAHAVAAIATTRLVAAGADEVSAAVAALFSEHGQAFRALSTHASAFHQEFVQALSSGAGSYLAAEGANASLLQTPGQDLLAVINAPSEALLGRPLIGNGTNGTAASPNGGAGGLLYGTGGTGYSETTAGVVVLGVTVGGCLVPAGPVDRAELVEPAELVVMRVSSVRVA